MIAADGSGLFDCRPKVGGFALRRCQVVNVRGLKSHNNVAANATKAGDLVPVTVGMIYNLTAFNPHATDVAYLHFYDARQANVTVGSTTPKRTFPLPPLGGVDTAHYGPIEFSTGITYAVTHDATGAVAPSSACVVGFEYTLAG